MAKWRASILDKELNVNAGMTKVIVGSRGGKMMVNGGVCGKRVQANSVQCTICNKCIHKWCSGVRSDLLQVVDGLRCKRYDGTIQEADLA